MRISDWSSDVCSSDLDYSGTFFQGLKRYRAAKRVLTNLNLLNRIRPRELADFMIQRRQLPRSKAGRLLILRRAFNLVVGVKQGNVKARSEERRVGKECVSTYRSRGSADH